MLFEKDAAGFVLMLALFDLGTQMSPSLVRMRASDDVHLAADDDGGSSSLESSR